MEKTQDTGTIKLYELGFHVLPSVPAEKISEKIEKIKEILEKNSAKIVSLGEPELINLAYEMRKDVGGKYEKYKQAYFCWVKFETDSESVNEIAKTIDALNFVLRHIIIKTVVDGDHTTRKLAEEELAKLDKKAEPVEITSEEKVADKPEDQIIDEAIDALVE